MSAIHLCRPATLYVRGIRRCPDCKKLGRWAGFEQVWYGVTATCLNCGRSWADGFILPLPFERAARPKAIARAKEMWAQAVGWRSPAARAWLREQRADVLWAALRELRPSADYRIALRPDHEYPDLLDDVVVNDVSCFHMEDMGESWWIGCYLAGTDDRITFSARWDRKLKRVVLEVGERPIDPTITYEAL